MQEHLKPKLFFFHSKKSVSHCKKKQQNQINLCNKNNLNRIINAKNKRKEIKIVDLGTVVIFCCLKLIKYNDQNK